MKRASAWSDSKMRIGFVSSYLPQRCGIAAYTASLAAGIRSIRGGGDGPFVISECGSLDGRDRGTVSFPTFRRSEDYAFTVAERASALGLDVLHIQHSADILGTDARLLRLLVLRVVARISI